MRIIPAAVLLALLAGCNEAERGRISDLGDAFYCRLYPSKCVPVPMPRERPAVEPAAPWSAPPVVLLPEPPPVVEAPVVAPVVEPDHVPDAGRMVAPKIEPARPRVKKFKPVERKVRPPKPKAESGPDLPYPCWLVRMKAAGKTEAELRAMGKANGITLTPKQERQARACLR